MAESTSLEHILHELDKLPVSAGARAQFLGFLERFAGTRVHLSKSLLIKPGKVHLASRLLDQGMGIAQASDVMVQRTGISKRTSYRLITLALAHRFRERQIDMFGAIQDGNP
jgi:hypothetical protein